MKNTTQSLLLLFFFFFSVHSLSISSNAPLSDNEVRFIQRRQLLYYRDEFGDRGEKVTVDPSLIFENPRLRSAYIALQAWKQAILSDPNNITVNWIGSNVCNYTGVFCSRAPDNRQIRTVAGIDLNHADIAGYLPEELGLLTDLALFHVNSNRDAARYTSSSSTFLFKNSNFTIPSSLISPQSTSVILLVEQEGPNRSVLHESYLVVSHPLCDLVFGVRMHGAVNRSLEL